MPSLGFTSTELRRFPRPDVQELRSLRDLFLATMKLVTHGSDALHFRPYPKVALYDDPTRRQVGFWFPEWNLALAISFTNLRIDPRYSDAMGSRRKRGKWVHQFNILHELMRGQATVINSTRRRGRNVYESLITDPVDPETSAGIAELASHLAGPQGTVGYSRNSE